MSCSTYIPYDYVLPVHLLFNLLFLCLSSCFYFTLIFYHFYLIYLNSLFSALSHTFIFKTGKSPGLDGFPIEFYKVFCEEIKGPRLTCFNYSDETGELSPTHREGLISLLL